MNDSVNSIQNEILDSFNEGWSEFLRQLPNIAIAILIVAVGLLLSAKISGWSRAAISNRTHDPIMTNFLSKAIRILFSGFVIMYALKIAGLQSIATTVLAAAGASTIIIGFAFRDIGENFISGIILSFNRPFNVNETVSIGDLFGKVQNIEFRYTKLKTFDGRDVYVPNSDVLKKPVYNYTEDGFYRFDFFVGIGYENDIARAETIIMERLESIDCVYQDQRHINFVYADELAVNTVNLKVHFWIKTLEFGREALLKKGKVVAEIKRALLAEGFNLPANIQELKLYGTEKTLPIAISSLDRKDGALGRLESK